VAELCAQSINIRVQPLFLGILLVSQFEVPSQPQSLVPLDPYHNPLSSHDTILSNEEACIVGIANYISPNYSSMYIHNYI